MDEGEEDVSAMSSVDGKSSRVKPGSTKKSSTSKKKKIAAIKEEVGYEDEDELMLWEREAKVNSKAEKEKAVKARRTGKGDVGAAEADVEVDIESATTPQSERKKKPAAAADAQSVRSLTSNKEIVAGELRGSSGLEKGAKQRKTNKQFQSFDVAEAESINDARKEKGL